eukprot:1068706-Pyramimonas_sp.AAC.1
MGAPGGGGSKRGVRGGACVGTEQTIPSCPLCTKSLRVRTSRMEEEKTGGAGASAGAARAEGGRVG